MKKRVKNGAPEAETNAMGKRGLGIGACTEEADAMMWKASDEGEVDTEVGGASSASGERPTPQVLSIGEGAASETTMERPPWAATIAVAKSAGPPHAMKRSGFINCSAPNSTLSSMVLSLTG
jgi:hypothetical protein